MPKPLLLLLLSLSLPTSAAPNLLIFLADDMGVGDLSHLNPNAKVQTPHLDRLARQGVTFTDAHTPSAVCTPTRYGLLTGRYPWRSRLKAGVLYGYSPHLIPPTRLTLPKLLKQHGYHTAAVGKWHLGMDWPGAKQTDDSKYVPATLDYAQPIANGPTAVGFDYFYGISASLDMPPYVWIENDRTVGLPTATKKWIREGPAHPDFEAVDVLPAIADRSIQYIRKFARDPKAVPAKPAQPFFLYVPLASPHTPILPTREFAGKTPTPYLDFVAQTDHAVGQILAALDQANLADDTLVLFTADNGCSPAAGWEQLLALGHHPSGPYRGHKADLFEGGHRVPFLVRWPAKIKPATTSDQTVCLTDLLATAADLVNHKLPPDAGEDSVSLLPALLNTATAPLREATVTASIDGSLAIRQGPWKLLLTPGSGGWSPPRTPAQLKDLPPTQLYNLTTDPAEATNLQATHPEIVQKLTTLLDTYITNGRSTPGPNQPNDTPTKMRK